MEKLIEDLKNLAWKYKCSPGEMGGYDEGVAAGIEIAIRKIEETPQLIIKQQR